MDCDKIKHLLVEVQEGTISPEDKKVVDLHVSACRECSQDLKLIGETFGILRNVGIEEPPSHYFTNLLPKIHTRIDKGSRMVLGFALPEWAQRLLAPASAIALVVCIVGLYGLLGPGSDSAQTHLEQIVSQLPRDEMDEIAESTNFSPIMSRAIEPSQRLSESFSNFLMISNTIDRELADDEVIHGHRMTTVLAADNSFEDINDENVDSIIQRLKEITL